MNKSFLNKNISDSIIGIYILSCLIIIGLYVLFSLPMLLLGEFIMIPLVSLIICVWVSLAFLLQSRLKISMTYSLGWVSVIVLFAAPPLIYKYLMYQVDGGSGLDSVSRLIGAAFYAFGWLGTVIGAWIVVKKYK